MNKRYAGEHGGGSSGCIARYVGGGGGCGLYDISMVDRMMMKFRPIAPKPVTSGSGSGSGSCEYTTANGGRSGRGKRRYVRVKCNNKNKNTKKRKVSTSTSMSSETVPGGRDMVVTLSLMPETPSDKWGSFKNNNQTSRDGHVTIPDMDREKTSVDGGGLVGLTEMEMEMDTCPIFLSDGGDTVVWMNKAYREMAGEEVVVVRKEGGKLPAVFTCNVRLVTCRSGRMSSTTKTVPCDVWRMDGGGYAWRLDVNAALSLGR